MSRNRSSAYGLGTVSTARAKSALNSFWVRTPAKRSCFKRARTTARSWSTLPTEDGGPGSVATRFSPSGRFVHRTHDDVDDPRTRVRKRGHDHRLGDVF